MEGVQYFSRLLEASITERSISQLHSFLLRCGLVTAPDCFFATRLVSSYAKRTSFSLARKLFDEISHPTSFLWNAILRAHYRGKQWSETLDLFRRMSANPSDIDSFTLSIALKACASFSAYIHGRAIHAFAVKRALHYSDMFVTAALVEMYAKCGDMGDAVIVFEGLAEPDSVLWTTVISGYQQNGNAEKARAFFLRMVVENHFTPHPVTLVSVLAALGHLQDIRGGQCCHGFLLRMGFDYHLSLMNSILNFYAKIGAVKTARNVFERMVETDIISWSCMISCYAHNNDPIAALKVYKKLIEIGMEPNAVTIVGALQACSLSCDLQEGKRMHEFSIHKGFELDKSVATSLIDMYMNCSCYEEAIHLFYRMPKKDVVTWAATIDGCAKNGFGNESIKLFKRMLLNKVNPDAVTMVKVLAACSLMGVLCQAHCFHGYLVRCGFCDKGYVGAALVDLYSKCGSLDDAIRVFEGVPEKDVVMWSSMIAGFSINGLGKKALATFKCMVESSVMPTNITFVSVLSACSHNGMLQEGKMIFDSMYCAYGITPDSKHYCIMVDLLSRTGELSEALKLIEEMPKPIDPHIWCALLSGCRSHQDVEMGEMVGQRLLDIDPSYAGYYNLLANMYAFGGKWSNAEVIKKLIKKRGLKKVPGHSTVEIGSEIHVYLAGEKLDHEGDKFFFAC